MASFNRKSAIPVMKAGKTQNTGLSQLATPSTARSSGIPKRVKAAGGVKPDDITVTPLSKKEEALKKQVANLEEDAKIRDLTINDLNDKLVERTRECQSLREESEAANFFNQEDSEKLEKLEKLLQEKEDYIQEVKKYKAETGRKFDAEMEMLKNQHEITVLSLQQRLEATHEEKLRELETSLYDEKKASGELREELSRVRDDGMSAELQEELVSTKLRNEDTIHELRDELKKERDEKDRRNGDESKVTRHHLVANGDAEDNAGSPNDELRLKFEKELEDLKGTYKEEIETLTYSLREKDFQIAELTQRAIVTKTAEDGASMTEDSPSTGEGKAYSHEQVAAMLDELRQQLTRKCERNITMANDLWRKKFEEEQGMKPKVNEETTTDDEDMSDDHEELGSQAKEMDARKLVKEISDLKIQLKEAIELQHDQAEVLEIQEKEMEELKESNGEFEERYKVLFKEMETKWQEEFSESDIIEKIKSHYEMEVELLHGDLEGLQTDNSNLKTELNLMANDFDGGNGGRNGTGGAVRKNSASARLDLKAEVEDYKVQVTSLERDLQHALNQNERLKMEHNARGSSGEESGIQQTDDLRTEIAALEQEMQKVIAERDDFRIRLADSKKEKKRIEKDLGSRVEAEAKVGKELEKKGEDMVAYEKRHNEEVTRLEEEISHLRTTLDDKNDASKTLEAEVASMKEKLEESGVREKNLLETIEESERKESDAKIEREKLQSHVNELLPLVKEHDRLKGEYDEKVEELKDKEMYSREVEKSKERVGELETMLSESKKEYEGLREKYDNLYKENKERNSGLDEKETALSQKRTDYEELKVTCEKLNRENETRIERIDEFEAKLREKQANFEDLKAHFDKLNRERETKTQKIDELQSTLSETKMKYEELNVEYDKLFRENKTTTSRIGELETTLNEKKIECEELKAICEKLKRENETKTAGNDKLKRENASRIGELETAFNGKKTECEKLKAICEKLKRENETKTTGNDEFKRENASRIGELETAFNEKETECEELKACCDKLKRQIKTNVAGNAELQTKVAQMETEHESLKEEHGELVVENERKSSKISELEKEGSRIRKQVMAFEKRMASQEREKKSLEEKNRSLGAQVVERGEEISRLKRKCELHDLAKTEIGEKSESLENTRETTGSCVQQNKELSELVEEMIREKNAVLGKQSQLMKDNSALSNDKDRLDSEMEALEATLEEEKSGHERKLSVIERKVKEKDRVLTETKRQSKQLKETLKELEEKCSDLQGEIETTNEDHHKESKKMRGVLDNAKKSHSAKERELREELVKQKDQFECELVGVKENMDRANQIEVATITRELQEKLELGYARDAKGMREEMGRTNEENHALKIQVDNMAIEVSKEKEEKYKLEKLKDQFRFQVQNLQQSVEAEREKLLQVQNEHFEVSKEIEEDKEKVAAALKEYQSHSTKLSSDIQRASNALKITKEKYGKLKEKHTVLSKKYAKLNGEKMNKSDVQVGPDDTIDFSQIMEDLQRSREETEESNCRLRQEIESLREEMAKGGYQIKAVRKANVVLMKQSRCLYQETEERKRAAEERSRELETSRKLNETLTLERDGFEKEQEALVSRVRELDAKTTRVDEQCEGYFVAKNKMQIALEEKNRECSVLAHQLDKVKEENAFLYRQGRKLQSELENVGNQRAQVGRPTVNPEEGRNVYPNVERDARAGKYNNLSKEVVRSASPSDVDGEGSLTASRASDYSNNQSLEEARYSTPVLFNNVKTDEGKMTEKVEKYGVKNQSTTRNPSKDTNLQVSRNLMNNEFATEKYLGSTYWETLAFLKKK